MRMVIIVKGHEQYELLSLVHYHSYLNNPF
jgi:hypothetical protein